MLAAFLAITEHRQPVAQSGPARFKAFDWEQLCLLDVQCDLPLWLSCTVAQASVIVLSLRKELCSRKSAAIAERGHVGWVWWYEL